jgi:hypothetical protein
MCSPSLPAPPEQDDITAEATPTTQPATPFNPALQTQADVAQPPSTATKLVKDDVWCVLLKTARRRKLSKSPILLATVAEDAKGDIEMTEGEMKPPVPIESVLQIPKVEVDLGNDEVDHVISEMKDIVLRVRC